MVRIWGWFDVGCSPRVFKIDIYNLFIIYKMCNTRYILTSIRTKQQTTRWNFVNNRVLGYFCLVTGIKQTPDIKR